MVKIVELVGLKRKLAILVAGSLLLMPMIDQSVLAQELTESHLAAAKKAIISTNATIKLNDILPTAAARLATQMISSRPDLETPISVMVNEAALEIAPRRGNLQVEVAKIYGRIFKEDELVKIAKFFSTSAGQKFLTQLPLVVREVEKASRIWGTGISRDLNQAVRKKMQDAKIE
ncbi:MAG: DUF2059 domain-containing protein [Hyphomicrobiales bacterium]|nr:DUF2059 domain-containing protein [Hyphomicrobiales bacterium]